MSRESFDAVVVGAGFGGLYMLHRLRKLGLKARCYEGGSGVGGTWFWNRYPGARCDVESLEYSYQFDEDLQQEWEWSERYAAQPEIMRYLNHVADRFDLRRSIQFETRVQSGHFDNDRNRWRIETDRGAADSTHLIMATGNLSSTNTPNFEGVDTFAGEAYHTGSWPHEKVDFSGKRVGIVGTGSSSIQAVPVLAQEAEHLYVFQRTANFSVPSRNGRLAEEVQRDIKSRYKEFREEQRRSPIACFLPPGDNKALEVSAEEREKAYQSRWQSGGLSFLGVFSDLMTDMSANETAAEFVKTKIRDIVKDPEVAALLTPDHAFGCKRPCADTGYYEAFNRPNVTLVDVSTAPIEGIRPEGIQTAETLYELDSLIFATGFDAMTGALDRIDLRGLDGVKLKDKWVAGPTTYLGITTAGFPNLFLITGPGSPSVLANMVTGVEQHAEWIADCIAYLGERGHQRIEPTQEAETAWVEHVNAVADHTLYPTCNSWYLGANIPGKKRVFMPYIGRFPTYEKKCQEVVANGYEGFTFE